MRNYEDRAKDFIKQIFPYVKGCHNVLRALEQVDSFNQTYNRKVRVAHGIARIALITSDYVVKFDYDKSEVEAVGGGENEIKMYAIAEREGFAYLFAKVSPYCYKGMKFYIMPLIRGIGRGHGYAHNWMTEEEYDFCEDHYLTDLHSNNYGFRNGHVCIVDYACIYEPQSLSDC